MIRSSNRLVPYALIAGLVVCGVFISQAHSLEPVAGGLGRSALQKPAASNVRDRERGHSFPRAIEETSPLQSRTQSSPVPASTRHPERIVPNQNRRTAGRLTRGGCDVRLEARTGEWFPDGDDGQGMVVRAFGTEGGRLEIPGPLVRIPQGTQVRATIRNRLGDPLVMHGLLAREDPAAAPIPYFVIPPGETRQTVFVANEVGTFFYWAATNPTTPLQQRSTLDSMMAGAIVVDAPGTSVNRDRIFVLGGTPTGTVGTPDFRVLWSINGLSWPHTERLEFGMGATVRMRVINTSLGVHPMHLHGFYFRVERRGDESEDVPVGSDRSPYMAVTERLAPARTALLTWVPTRPGNWLFHCHDNVHIEPGGTLEATQERSANADGGLATHNHAMMAGLVVGIRVRGTSTRQAFGADTQRLRLTVRVAPGSTAADPAYGYALTDQAAVQPESLLPGPLLIVERNRPVSITVANELAESTTVHWHGIELESYYDGVAGFAGDGKKVAPAILPGGSFEARFVPPRSGTFMYHTHFDDSRQLKAGLSGPLLVVDSLAAYDRSRDIVLMVTTPRKTADAGGVLINGSPHPTALEWRRGERYRIRLIDLHISRPSMRMRLRSETQELRWTPIAKDGADLSAEITAIQEAEVQMGNGETYDFEFAPSVAETLRFEVLAGNGSPLASLNINVRD